jgi:hypothetical protein
LEIILASRQSRHLAEHSCLGIVHTQTEAHKQQQQQQQQEEQQQLVID